MTNENCVLSDQYKRIQGGFLKVRDKNVCVYKGVNTVGRNKTATINLKNLNVSQNHAVIVIVDDTQHFISDLNSSNGTYLVGTKLSPFKLYELVNDVEVKFGDVVASYFKVSNADTTLHLEKEHFDMTQNMTQSFYGAATQLMINESSLNQTKRNSIPSKTTEDVENLHEAATQVVMYPPQIRSKFTELSTNSTGEIFDKNIHEERTQLVDHQPASTSKAFDVHNSKIESDSQPNCKLKEIPEENIFDLETQVVDRKTLNNDRSSSTQINEGAPKVENSVHLNNDSLFPVSIVEETVIEETVMEENWIENDANESNDSIDFLAMRKSFENETACSKDENDKDSFLETQEVRVLKKPVRKLSSSEDFSQPDNKKTCNSDSETDIEKSTQSQPAKKEDDSGSDTEIEDDLPKRLKTKTKIPDSDSETDIEGHTDNTDVLTDSQGVIKPKILTKKRVLDSDSETDIEDEKESPQNKKGNVTEVLNDTDFIPATQDAFAEVFMYKDLKSKSNLNSENLSSEESFKLGLTELMVESVENKVDEGKGVINEENLNVACDNNDELLNGKAESNVVDECEKDTVEDLYMMPTQKVSDELEDKSESPNEMAKKLDRNQDTNSSVSATAVESKDFYVMPTQKLNKDVEDERISTPSTSKTTADEDFYMMATQKLNENESESQFKTPRKQFNFRKKRVVLDASLSSIFSGHQSRSPSFSTKQKQETGDKNEDIYLQATQRLEEETQPIQDLNLKPSTSEGNKEEEDFYMAPTQKISLEENNEKPESILNSDVHSQKNQHENVEGATFKATEKITENDGESQFKTPRKQFHFGKKRVVLDIFSSNQSGSPSLSTKQKNETDKKNEDIYLQATQRLEGETQNGLYLQPTQDLNLKPSTSENKEEEDFYMAPTQKISSEENKEKSEDILKSDLQKNEYENVTTSKDAEKIEDDPYTFATQQVNPNLTNNEANSVGKSTTDLYLQETQNICVDQKSEATKEDRNKMLEVDVKTLNTNSTDTTAFKVAEERDEDAYMAPTQQIYSNLVDKEAAPPKPFLSDLYLEETEDIGVAKELKTNTSVKDDVFKTPIQTEHKIKDSKTSSGEKRKVECDPNTPKAKRIKNIPEDDTDAETLSQIDAFIKQPFGVTKQTTEVDSIPKVKHVDQSETLSQIQRFVAEPFENITKNKLQTVPKKRRGSSSSANKQTFVAAQTENDIKNELSTVKTSKNTPNTEEEGPHQLKDGCKTSGKPETGLSVSNDTRISKNEQDAAKPDIEISFALLEAKSTKTRKSKRLTDSSEVNVTLCKNRRSMAVVPETSELPENKPSTRKSNKKLTSINNNDLPIPEIPETKVTGKSKRKLEPTKKETCEPEKPNKISRTTRGRKGKQKEADVFELAVPSTSKLKDDCKATSSKDSDNSSNSVDSTLFTPSRRGRRTTQSTSDFVSPEKSKRKQKPKVVFTMLDSPLLESLIKQLGGSVVDSVESSTVLVTEHVKRSQKLLTAIGQGKPICSPEWIRASKKANEFLDPWDFILTDKEAESKWNFSLKQSLIRAGKEKLLGNYTFQLIVSNAVDVLKGAIEACGGKCVPRHPAKSTDGFFVVISSPENRSKYLKIKKQHPQVTVVEPEAVFDGVLRQDLRLGRHLLT